jgi:tRNA dimethylallyltransferase
MDELVEMLKSLKPKLHNKTDIDTKKRVIRAIEIELYYKQHPAERTQYPEIKALLIGVKFDRMSQRERITQRLYARLNAGMVDEVKRLLDSGIKPEDLIYYGLEYKYITLYLIGQLDYDTMVRKLNTAIHKFMKRQMTWFRHMERLGVKIHWLDGYMSMEQKLQRVSQIVNNCLKQN